MAAKMSKPTLSVSEAARRCGVDRTTIQRKIREGKLNRTTGKGGIVGVTLESLRQEYPNFEANREAAAGGAVPHAVQHAAEGAVQHPSTAVPRRMRQGVRYSTPVQHAAEGQVITTKGDTLPPQIAARIAELEARLEEKGIQIAELKTAHDNHIKTLTAELERAHAKNDLLNMQIADARRHETARLQSPKPEAVTIDGDISEIKTEPPEPKTDGTRGRHKSVLNGKAKPMPRTESKTGRRAVVETRQPNRARAWWQWF